MKASIYFWVELLIAMIMLVSNYILIDNIVLFFGTSIVVVPVYAAGYILGRENS